MGDPVQWFAPMQWKFLSVSICYGYIDTYYLIQNTDVFLPRVKKMSPYVIFKILSAEINYNHWT